MLEVTRESIPPPDLKRLASCIQEILEGEWSQANRLEALLKIGIGLVNSPGIIYFRGTKEGLAIAGQLLSKQASSWSEDLVSECRNQALTAIQESTAMMGSLARSPEVSLISCPLPGSDKREPSCLTALAVLGGNEPEPFLVTLQLLTTALETLYHRPNQTLTEGPLASQLPAFLKTSENRLSPALLADFLRSWSGAAIIAVGKKTGTSRIVLDHLSDVIDPDRRTELATEYTQMLGECLRAGEPQVWPASGDCSSSLVLKGLLRSTGMHSGAVVPLGHPNRSQTALLLLWQETPKLHTVVEELEGLGMILDSLFRSFHSVLQRPRRAILGWKKGIGIAVALVAMVAISLLPFPYKLQVKAQVEPIELRYVVARFDAIVKDVLVEPGDRLEQEELLALLDGREIELELAAVVADSAKAMKLRDNHLVSGNIAAAQIALLEYQQLVQREKLLRERLTRLALVSPIAGVLLSGDLKRQIEGPVTKGQALFEIAPLERVLVTLGIPDEEISHVTEQAAIEVRFDSFPDLVWQGKIKSISPQTEAFNGQNLFAATSEFTNRDDLLQPGMSGRASISCGRQSLLWIYFHKPWYALLRLLDTLG